MAYSENFISEALIALAVNKYDYKTTAEQLGCSQRALRNWEAEYPKKMVPQLLERAIEKMLLHIPKDFKGADWGVVLGILMDKYLLINGQATARTENSIVTLLQGLPDNELNDLIKEFEHAANNGNAIVKGGKEKTAKPD